MKETKIPAHEEHTFQRIEAAGNDEYTLHLVVMNATWK